LGFVILEVWFALNATDKIGSETKVTVTLHGIKLTGRTAALTAARGRRILSLQPSVPLVAGKHRLP
jgi:hypothetical protein